MCAVLAACSAAAILELRSARRFEFAMEPLDPGDREYSPLPYGGLYLDPETHGLAAVVRISVQDPRFVEGLAQRVSVFPDLERYPTPRPAAVGFVSNDPTPHVSWWLPRPVVERFSLREMRWIRVREPGALEREQAATDIINREARAWLEEQAPLWRERSIEERERRLVIRRRSLEVRRASSDRLRISENWGEHRDETWDEHRARLDRIEGQLAQLLSLVERLPEPLPGQFTILLEGLPENTGERRLTDAIDTPEELLELFLRATPFELRDVSLRRIADRIRRETGIYCHFSVQGPVPDEYPAPDLEQLLPALESSELLARNLGAVGFTERWRAGQPPELVLHASSAGAPGEVPLAVSEPLALGAGRAELEVWCRRVASSMPAISTEGSKLREQTRSRDPGQVRRELEFISSSARHPQERTDGPWPMFASFLLPGLPYRIGCSDREVELVLDGRSTGAISFDPKETFTERFLAGHSSLLEDSESDARWMALLTERNRIEREYLDCWIPIEPDLRLANSQFAWMLRVLEIALARAPDDAWYHSDPFREIRITVTGGCGFNEEERRRALDLLSRASFRVPAYPYVGSLRGLYGPFDRSAYTSPSSTPELVEKLLAAPPKWWHKRPRSK